MIDQFDINDTIVAQASAREPGYPRGIVRISGPETLNTLEQCFQPDHECLKDCRSPSRLEGAFHCDHSPNPIPVEVLLWPTSQSYTRQVSAEVHAPGALPLLDAIVHQLCTRGARLARPGEFTMRAFLSGRMDLTEAEAVLGVIDAQDQRNLNVALKQLAGGLSRSLQAARHDLLATLAHLEAGLDFVEDDIEFVSAEEVLRQIKLCSLELERLKQQLAHRDQTESGLKVVLFGQPNTGKSSLFNVMIDRFGKSRKQAIVSDVSGTTRDFIAGRLTIDGLEFLLVDTAGLEQSPDPVADSSPLARGQDQSLVQEAESSITLFCLDRSRVLNDWERSRLADADHSTIICWNKSDIQCQTHEDLEIPGIRLSAHSGLGIQELAQQLVVLSREIQQSESIPATAVRCATIVDDAIDALNSAAVIVTQGVGEELIAGEIRMALNAIGQITGTVYTDDILDVVFKQFCIGK